MTRGLDFPGCLALACLAWLLLVGAPLGCVACSSAPEPQTAAKCAGIRAFYDQAQTELIDRGACDSVDSVSDCLPHVALREALVASLKEAECH